MLPPIPSHYTFGATVPLYESNQIEFKVSTISFDKLKKTVCAFLNTIGGYIFIGINDSRQICGIEPKIADNSDNICPEIWPGSLIRMGQIYFV